ncbi:hypothetical protein Ae201684P_001965 [Aphanomyces euteiches]|uniref:Uncharacterized protein n=1 Tax=Aphanomyces euteiches TaxID=100861 RepID=A0A6G0XKY3_9STRA|nr:hypothetical protein Ae201684_003649 [Aphanomyces euteiches]KAH9084725.1 hypothetical protein Ae201684P_001965 [Aphanomyces euteiches]
MDRSKTIEDAFEYVKTERSRVVTKYELLMILRLHASLRDKNLPDATQRIVHLSGRSLKVVKGVWTEFRQHGTVTEASPAANRLTHAPRVPIQSTTESLVHDFVRERRLTKTRQWRRM